MYDCYHSEATTAGPTASICLSVCVSQHKLQPGIFHNRLTSLYGMRFSPLCYLNSCQAFLQSFPIFSLVHPFCFFSITWHNLSLFYVSRTEEILFTEQVYTHRLNLTWLKLTICVKIEMMVMSGVFCISFIVDMSIWSLFNDTLSVAFWSSHYPWEHTAKT